MEENENFVNEIVNLSDSDLKRIYEMACEKIKLGRASGKDVSTYEQKLTVISAELVRRRKTETIRIDIIDPDKANLIINDPDKANLIINDPDKVKPIINDPDKTKPIINKEIEER